MAAKPRGEGRNYRPRMTQRAAEGLIELAARSETASSRRPCEAEAAKYVRELVRWWNRKRRERGGRA